MINHFKSTLLNLPAPTLTAAGLVSREIHVAPGYGTIALPADLQALYAVLFPTDDTEARVVLANIYLGLVYSCGMAEALLSFDSRITQEVRDYQKYFSSKRISKGVPLNAQASAFNVRVFNYKMDPPPFDAQLIKTVRLEQVDNTNNLRVFDFTDTLIGTHELSFSSGQSQLVPVVIDGVKIFDAQFLGSDFTATSDKEWRVLLHISFRNHLRNVYLELYRRDSEVHRTITRYLDSNYAEYYELWRGAPNWLYRLAGLVVSYVSCVNSLNK